jgi:tetratricopeptide (TPR) repeat protein
MKEDDPMFFKKKKKEEPSEPAKAAGRYSEEDDGPKGPHPAEPRFKQGMELLNNERYDEAIPIFEDVMRRYPEFEPSMVLYGLGVAYDGKGWLDHAAGALQKSIQANVQNFEAHIFLGNLYAKMGKTHDAVTEYTFVIDNKPDHELVPGLQATVKELKGFSTGDAHVRMVEDLEAFRVMIKRQVKVDLPYDIKGLQILEMIMETGFSDTVLCGAFIGEVIVRTFGGTWKMVTPREQSYIEAPNGTIINPFELASGKVEGGKGYSLAQQYKALGPQFAQ